MDSSSAQYPFPRVHNPIPNLPRRGRNDLLRLQLHRLRQRQRPNAANFTLTLTGAAFTANSLVRWNGSDRPTTFVSATTLTAAIPATDVDEIGTFPVTFYDHGLPTDGTDAVMFYVVEEVWEVFLPVVGR